MRRVTLKNVTQSETQPSGLVQSTQYHFSLPDTWWIVLFYPANFFSSQATFYPLLSSTKPVQKYNIMTIDKKNRRVSHI